MPSVDVLIDEKIVESRAITDPEARFRALRGIRIELTRAVEEMRVQRITIQEEITRQEALRKSFSAEAKIKLESVGPTIEEVESDLSTAKERTSRLEEQVKAPKPGDPDVAKLNSDLEQARAYQKKIEVFLVSLKGQKETEEKRERDRTNALDTIDHRIEQLRGKEAELSKIQIKLAASQTVLDDEIGGLLKTETQRNEFKTRIALAFTALVGLVILGFFGLSCLDHVVRRSIFSSESGIQFLTLFSVVIAIILFGITGILESKELAALLGGLSGYILGRVASTPPRQAPEPAPQPAPAPVLAPAGGAAP